MGHTMWKVAGQILFSNHLISSLIVSSSSKYIHDGAKYDEHRKIVLSHLISSHVSSSSAFVPPVPDYDI